MCLRVDRRSEPSILSRSQVQRAEGTGAITNTDRNSAEFAWLVDSYFLRTDGSRMTLRLSQPLQCGADWKVVTYLEGIDGEAGSPVYGVDPVQAILMSFARVRFVLEKAEPTILFEARHSLQSAFPRFVPFAYGDTVRERIENFIDQEIDNWGNLAGRNEPDREE